MPRKTRSAPRRRRDIIAAAAMVASASFVTFVAAPVSHAATVFWDTNGTTAGAGGATPAGTWGTDAFWNSVADGTGATTTWTGGDTANFSAGTDAIGTFTVTVSGTQAAGGITFEEGTLTLSGGTLNLTGPTVNVASGTDTISSVVAGAVGLTKTGTGALVLTGANTYTGVTTVSAGSISFGNGGISGALPGNVTNNAALIFNRSDDLSYGVVISGSGSFSKSGSGILTLTTANSYTGGTVVNGGTLRLGINNAAATGAMTVAAGTLALNGFNQSVSSLTFGNATATAAATVSGVGTLTLAGDVTFSGAINNTTLPATLASNATMAATRTFTSASSNASTEIYDLVISGVLNGAGGLTKAGADNFDVVLTTPATYTGATTVNFGILALGVNNALSASSAVTVASLAGLSTALFDQPGVTGGSYNQALGSLAGAGNVLIGSATFTVGSLNTSTTFSGGFNDFGFGGSLIKVGTGTLTLTGGNTYFGGTTISAGTLSIGSGSTTGTVDGNILNNAALIINRSNTIVVSGNITGTGTLTKSASGLTTLSGTNIYSGGTTVSGGVLRAIDGTNLPATNVLTLNGGVYEPTTATHLRTNGAAAGNVRVTGGTSGFSAFGTALVVDLGGNGTGTGPTLTWGSTNFAPSTFVLNATTADNTLDFKNAINLSTGVTSRTVQVNANTATISGVISGTSTSTTLTKSGAGILLLRAASNTYAGPTSVSAGTLDITLDSQLGAVPSSPLAASLTLSGGTLQAGASFTLNSNRGLSVGANGATVNTNSFNVTYLGAIAGTGTFTKSGSGNLTLGTGNSGYSGALSITGGTLIASASSSLGSATAANTSLTLSGGTLQTTGGIASAARSVVVGAGGATFNTNGFGSTFGNVAASGSTTGNLSKTGAGNLTVNHVRIGGALSVTGGKLITAPSGLAAGTSVINTVSVTGAQLDLTNNHLIVKATPIGSWTGSVYTDVLGLVASGRGDGTWNGNGITTSMTDATSGSGYTVLAAASASEVRGIGATATDVWAGQTVTGSDALVMYTYGGDTNLSGNVDVDDYGQIDFNASTGGSLKGWFNGDFDYNGIQDVDDYGMIDFVINIQGPPFFTSDGAGSPTVLAAVPEPALLALLPLGACLMRRRRCK